MSAKLDLAEWARVDRESWARKVPSGPCLLDRLPPEFYESLTPLEALALASSPEAYLRPDQCIPWADESWSTALVMPGRGFGKSFMCAGGMVQLILTADRPSDFALIAPTLPEVETLQWNPIKALLPEWVRYHERPSANQVIFPDHGPSTLYFHSGHLSELRGPNLRGAWGDEVLKWRGGVKLYDNLELAVRVPGKHPPRIILSTTPPEEITWLLELACRPTTLLIRGEMADNPALDRGTVRRVYAQKKGTPSGERELKGNVTLTVEGAKFKAEHLEQHRVSALEVPKLERIVTSIDPTDTGGQYADEAGAVSVGIAEGHLYVLESWCEVGETDVWATEVIDQAIRHDSQWLIAESKGIGSVKNTLTLTMQVRGLNGRWPIHEAEATESKSDRADPLSIMSARGLLHIVGHQAKLESQLTTWHPALAKRWSPAGLDALVHAAHFLTEGYLNVKSTTPTPKVVHQTVMQRIRATTTPRRPFG